MMQNHSACRELRDQAATLVIMISTGLQGRSEEELAHANVKVAVDRLLRYAVLNGSRSST